MGIMHIVWMFIVGIVVGAIARFLMPGAENLGIFMTGVIGIVGSFVGGFIGSLISKPVEGSMFHPAGFVMSVIGAILVLFLWKHFMA